MKITLIVIGLLVFFIGFAILRFINLRGNSWYEYKGKRYRVVMKVDCKDRTSRFWYSAIIYKNEDGQLFCRPTVEFTNRFVPVKNKY